MHTPGPPPETLTLTWEGERRFSTQVGSTRLVLDGARGLGPSPVQALLLGLAGCMAIDVVDILEKGRLSVAGVRARIGGERRPEPPRYFERIDLHFEIDGSVPPDRVERAIALSRERYCSVLHCLRSDIDVRTSFEIRAPAPAGATPAPDRG